MGACCSGGEKGKDAGAKGTPNAGAKPEAKADGAKAADGTASGHGAAVEAKHIDLTLSPEAAAEAAAAAAEKKSRDDAFNALFAAAEPLLVDAKAAEANAARWEQLNGVLRAHHTRVTADAQKAVDNKAAELGLDAAAAAGDAEAKEFDAKAVDAQTETYLKALDKALADAAAQAAALEGEKHYEEVFKGYDLNGDGLLDVREHRLLYADSLRQQKAAAPALVAAHYDAVREALRSGRLKYAKGEDAKQRLHAIVKRLDTLQPVVTEKVSAALTANLGVADARADKVFRAMDSDRDGKVTLDQVKALYHRSPYLGLEVSYYLAEAVANTPFASAAVSAAAPPAAAAAPAADLAPAAAPAAVDAAPRAE